MAKLTENLPRGETKVGRGRIVQPLEALTLRVEALEREKTLTDKLVKDYANDDIDIKEEYKNSVLITNRKVVEKTIEPLSVEGILKEVYHTNNHKSFNDHSIKINALDKLLIIADYVNEGWKHKNGYVHYSPYLDEGRKVRYNKYIYHQSSPIKIHPDKWDKFTSIENIIPLIKEYLS